MLHPKQHIADLAEICHRKGIRRIVISPGSRSAPLIRIFYTVFGENCISIADERSAAYFALGMALYEQNTVVLICTSGTAVLNYAPALAEAFYQHVPLLAITADRPREWIDQQDNQTLRQPGIFANYIKGTFDLPQSVNAEDDIWYAQRTVNEAVDLCASPCPGPVHINIPLTEPLYDELPSPSQKIRIIQHVQPHLSFRLPDELAAEWQQASRIMIVHGQDNPGSSVPQILAPLSADRRIIIMAENISHVTGAGIVSNSNLVLSNNRNSSPALPDLIIHSGGQVVSKALTGYLRRAENIPCWRIGSDTNLIDTFRLVTRRIPLQAEVVYRVLSEQPVPPSTSSYRDAWIDAAKNVDAITEGRISHMPFSDVRVFNLIFQCIPPETILVLGNSSVIRYAQLFPANERLKYYANRGVSGIDGSLSTAAGLAFAAKKPTLILTGDLGFLYDSNALWNRELPANLRIVVINNSGGGIFHILKGPSEFPGFKQYIEAHHPVNMDNLASAYGLEYCFAGDGKALKKQWKSFLSGHAKASILEVKTDAAVSAKAFRKLMGTP